MRSIRAETLAGQLDLGMPGREVPHYLQRLARRLLRDPRFPLHEYLQPLLRGELGEALVVIADLDQGRDYLQGPRVHFQNLAGVRRRAVRHLDAGRPRLRVVSVRELRAVGAAYVHVELEGQERREVRVEPHQVHLLLDPQAILECLRAHLPSKGGVDTAQYGGPLPGDVIRLRARELPDRHVDITIISSNNRSIKKYFWHGNGHECSRYGRTGPPSPSPQPLAPACSSTSTPSGGGPFR
jgi:hypothetical protein